MIDHLIDRSDPGAWQRHFAQITGTRFITQPGEDGIERQTPNDAAEDAGVGRLNFHDGENA